MNTALIYSDLADDPILNEIIDSFVDEMPSRIRTLETLAHGSHWAQLSRTAHQLKGAAGGYGFHQLTPYAARLEQAARSEQDEVSIRAALDELLCLCRQVRSGVRLEA